MPTEQFRIHDVGKGWGRVFGPGLLEAMSKEIAAFVCSHVFEKRAPVLLVLRAEGDWQLLCGGDHDNDEIPHVIGLNHLVEEDPSLRTVLDLPAEWEEERSSLASSWERRPIA